MSPNQVVRHFGSQARAARFLGLTRAAVNNWVRKNRIPYRSQLWVEMMTNRQLVADRRRRPGRV